MLTNSGIASLLVAAGIMHIYFSAWAQDQGNGETVPVTYEQRFNDKINAWFDGTVTSVNPENGTFVVNGANRPYASAYAKMLKEIHLKTSKLEGSSRHEKEDEIRNAWREKLLAAQKEQWDKNSNLTFKLPSKDSPISVFDESRFYGRTYEPKDTSGTTRERKSKDVTAKTMGLKDLQVGEHVIVGYESGMLTNSAYAIICAQYPDYPSVTQRSRATVDQNTDGANGERTSEAQRSDNKDVEITRLIRQAIVKDDSLSTYAHNVKIVTENGAVTLKGLVRSDNEKQEIEKKAVIVAGEGKVTNQIEIQP